MFYLQTTKFSERKSLYAKFRIKISRLRLGALMLRADKITSVNKIITEKELACIKVISFDIFDTLLIRECHQPNRVIDQTCYLWADIISNELKVDISAINIRAIRDGIINRICSKNTSNGFDPDFNYDEFITDFREKLNLSKEVGDTLKAVEIENEIKHLRVNSDVFNTLEVLKKSGFKLIAISDMYFSSTILSSILSHFGLFRYFDNVYSSGELGKLKATGRLFEFLASIYEPKHWLHIGDNPLADYKAPRACGIRALLLSQGSILSDRRKSYVSQMKVAENVFVDIDDGYQGKVVKHLGFTVSVWMYDLAKYCADNNVSELYFIAREGAVIKKFFDEVKSAFFPTLKVKSTVLNISRKSINDPLFESYFLSEVNSFLSVIHIVDIGWGGTIQHELSKLIDKPIIGHYLGTDSRFDMLGRAFLFDEYSKKIQSIRFCFPILESLLTPNDIGTCIEYRVEESRVIPILSKPNSFFEDIDHSNIVYESTKCLENVLKKYIFDEAELFDFSRKLTFDGFMEPSKDFGNSLAEKSLLFDFGNSSLAIVVNPLKNPIKFIKNFKSGIWVYGCFSSCGFSWCNRIFSYLFDCLSINEFRRLIRKLVMKR